MNNKLAAFTMIELIVVMVLSGIIFSMALLVLDIVGQQASHQEEQHQEVLKIEQLQLLLSKDAYASTAIWAEQEQVFFEYDGYTIKYQFEEKMTCRSILQEPIHTDTFWLPKLALAIQWQQQPITTGRVDALTLESQFFGQAYTIYIQKHYASKTLLETATEQQQ